MKKVKITTLVNRLVESGNYRLDASTNAFYELSAGKSAFLYSGKIKLGNEYSSAFISAALLALSEGESVSTKYLRKAL